MSNRIPESFIDDVIARTDLVDLINRYVPLKRTGKNYSACCPFHQEKTPSFTVSPDKQFFYCFGCGASGNAVGFLMEYSRMGFVEALESLSKPLGMEIPRPEGQERRPTDHLKPLYDTLEAATVFYEKRLRDASLNHRAVAYLKGRGLTGQTAKQFRLGFAPPGWDNLIRTQSQDKAAQERLLKTGLLVENEQQRRYDRFRDRIIFPIRDTRGRVIAFGGRVLGDDKPKYLNSPETPVFHKGRELYGLYEARQGSSNPTRFIIVEGYMDVIALSQHGVPGAVATLGTATSQEHIEKLFRYSDELVFCFDGDQAGRQAAWRALGNALPTARDGRSLRFLLLPEGEDPDTLVRQHGAEFMERMMAEATPLSDFFFEHLSADLNLTTLDGRARLAKEAYPYLGKLPTGVYRQLMFNQLAELTQLSTEELERLQPAPQAQGGEQAAAQTEASQNSAPTTAHPLKSADAIPTLEESGDWTSYSAGFQPESSARSSQRRNRQHSSGGKHAGPRGNRGGENRGSKEELSLIDATIRLVLNAPRSVASATIPASLQDLQAPRIELLLEILAYLQARPETTTAALLGRWQAREDGHRLFQLAAREFLLPRQEQQPELQDALLRLELMAVEQALDNQIAAGINDKQRFRELMAQKDQLSRALVKQRD